jgi:hypothetical protein
MFDHLVQYWPAWLSLTVAGLLGINKLLEEYSKLAAFFGPIGKKIHARAAARQSRELIATEFAQAVSEAIEKAHDKWESEENAALQALDKRLATVSGITAQQKQDIDELLIQVRCLMAYSEYEVIWHQRLRIAALKTSGDSLPIASLPDHVDFYEFEPMYKADPHWRAWALRT